MIIGSGFQINQVLCLLIQQRGKYPLFSVLMALSYAVHQEKQLSVKYAMFKMCSCEGLSLVIFQGSWGGGMYFGTNTTHWNIGDLILLHSNDAAGATLKFISGRQDWLLASLLKIFQANLKSYRDRKVGLCCTLQCLKVRSRGVFLRKV